MNNRLAEVAATIAGKLDEVEKERRRIGLEGFAALERLDSETARLALEALGDRGHAARWLTEEIWPLGWKTPWRCLAEGRQEAVRRELNAIIYGLPA